MDQYSSFIDALGRELGIDIQLSPTGAAHFVIDGHGLLIQWTESRHAFVVYAEVGRLSGWRDGEVVKELMAANFLLLGSLGGAFSLDLSRSMVGLFKSITLESFRHFRITFPVCLTTHSQIHPYFGTFSSEMSFQSF